MKKFDFENSRGETLSGRLELPSVQPRAVALFAHCFTCSKDIIAPSVISKALTDHQIAVLRFDFTGLGASEGDFSNTNFSSNVEDLLAAYNRLSKEFMPPEILIGHSFGGAAVLKAALELKHAKAVVTIGAPSDVQHIAHLFTHDIDQIEKEGEADVILAGRKFTIKKQFIEDINEVEILTGVGNLEKALLVMHSPLDKTVGIEHAASIYEAAKHPKSFVSLDSADHLLMDRADAEYAADVVGAWVGRYLSRGERRQTVKVSSGEVLVRSRREARFTQDIYTQDHHIVSDEPLTARGDNLGLTPYELLLAGLGACTSMTLGMYAEHKGISLDEVSVRLTHEKIHATDCKECESTEGKIDRIQKSITLSGELTEEQRVRMLEIAERCPVNRTLQSEVEIA